MDEKPRSLTRLFTAETQRAQRIFVLCPSGDDNGQKQPNPKGKTDVYCVPPIAEQKRFLCRLLAAKEKRYLSALCVSAVSTCSG